MERALKGDIGPDIDVYSGQGGGDCGIDGPVGRRLGMLLYRQDDRWTGGLCSEEDPEVLVRAAKPLPPPDGRAPPAVLVGTTYGPGRVLSLDGRGRVIAYGPGDGAVTDIGFCPGSSALAEAYTLDPGWSSGGVSGLAVRTAGDLAVVAQQQIDRAHPGHVALTDIACLDPEAADVLAFVVDESHQNGEARYRGRVLSWGARRDRIREVWAGPAQAGVFTPDGTSAYVNSGPDGRDLLRIDLTDLDRPAVRSLVQLPVGTGPLALAPSGRYLAGTTSNPYEATPDGPIEAIVVDVEASPASVLEHTLGDRSAGASYGHAVWSAPDRVVFAPGNDEGEVQIFDAALTPVASWSGWGSGDGRLDVVGDRLVGLDYATVEVARVAGGPVTEWADLESGVPGTIAAFPGGAPIETAEPSPTSTTTTNGDEESMEAAGSGAGGRSGTAGRPLLVGGAGAVILAAGLGALALRRRRGSAVLP
ncbi:MAG: hypothetical protein M3357_19750 [Actinomycetota bacterium]|nr:hypothetical protein [Actinomycetota bacterium]